ncbi:hypothetical protein ACNJYD_08490 [Bradyrhizobium sp. DASA03005]|uniref:hypothetical protein n=1 Tax=Bradyrhizobium sp. SPXBL-02 TaxID=3395912 RepID=UPI003F7295E4
MHYVYALIFGVLISPIETLVRYLDGALFGTWDSFHEAITTGALFAYASILSCDALIRASLLPQAYRKIAKGAQRIHATALTLCVLSLVMFVMLWAKHSTTISQVVHVSAVGIAVSALILTFVAIWYDAQSRVFEQIGSISRSGGGRSTH